MTDDQTPALEAGDEVVAEAEQVDAPQYDENGQEIDQPAEGDAQEAESEEKTKSAERRERRKAALETLRANEAEATARANTAQEQLDRVRRSAQNLKKPTQADFPDYEEFTAALSAYHGVVAMDGRELQRLEEEARQNGVIVQQIEQRKQQEDAQNWESQIAEARTKYPDFERVALSDNVPITPEMARFIVQSDVAAEIAYEMGKNPAVATAMHGLAPVEMARAIGRLEAQLSAPKPKTTSTAPAPINPVKGKSISSKNPSEMSPQEFRAWEEAGGKF